VIVGDAEASARGNQRRRGPVSRPQDQSQCAVDVAAMAREMAQSFVDMVMEQDEPRFSIARTSAHPRPTGTRRRRLPIGSPGAGHAPWSIRRGRSARLLSGRRSTRRPRRRGRCRQRCPSSRGVRRSNNTRAPRTERRPPAQSFFAEDKTTPVACARQLAIGARNPSSTGSCQYWQRYSGWPRAQR
jgi:hypothetical protein